MILGCFFAHGTTKNQLRVPRSCAFSHAQARQTSCTEAVIEITTPSVGYVCHLLGPRSLELWHGVSEVMSSPSSPFLNEVGFRATPTISYLLETLSSNSSTRLDKSAASAISSEAVRSPCRSAVNCAAAGKKGGGLGT